MNALVRSLATRSTRCHQMVVSRWGGLLLPVAVTILLLIPAAINISRHSSDANLIWFLHVAAILLLGARWRAHGLLLGMLASLSIFIGCEIWPLPGLVDMQLVSISERLALISIVALMSIALGSSASSLAMAHATQRKLAEALAAKQDVGAALAATEHRHRSLIESLPAAVYIVGIDNTFETTYVSPQVEQMLGMTPDAWATLDETEWYAYVHPDDVDPVRTIFTALGSNGERVVYEYRFHHADGHWVWLRDEMVLVRDSDGYPAYWQGLMVDISDERHAAEHLRTVERRNRVLVDNLPAVVYANDVRDLYSNSYVSPHMQALLGIDPRTWADMSREEWLVGIHPDDRERVEAEHTHSDTTGEPLDSTYRYQRIDGEWIWIHDIMVLVRTDEGVPDYWQGVLVDITAQRAAAEALEASEERFRGIFEESPFPMVIADLDGRILRINDAHTALFGYAMNELESLQQVMHPDDLTESEANRTLLKVGKRDAYSSERRFIARNGTTLWTIFNLSLIRDRDRKPAYIVGHVQDITESRAREEAIKESESRFRNLFDSAPIAMAIGDINGHFTRINAAHTALFGYTEEEIIGKPVTILTHPDDFEDALHNRNTVGSDTNTQTTMRRYRTRDGSTVWGLLSLSLLYSSDGTPINIVAQVQDITEIRAAEANLRDSEARFRGAFDNSPVGISLSTPEGHYHRINRAFCTMLGYTEKELLGMHYSDFTHPDDIAANDEEQRMLVDGEAERFQLEKRYIHRNGQDVWTILNSSIVRDEEGNPQFVVGQVQDISDRKALEQRLQYQAFHDALTDLPNRSLFVDRLDHAIMRSARSNERLAVLYLDLDGFKAVNDSMGHAAGDELLIAFAQRLRGWVRADDTVARLGGDEFTVLLESLTSLDEALTIAQRIVDGTRLPHTTHGQQVYVRASVGLAYTEGGNERPQTLLHHADLALYHAKTVARTTVVVYTPSMHNAEITHLMAPGITPVVTPLSNGLGSSTG